MNGRNGGQPVQMKVNINDLPMIECSCGSTLFVPLLQLRKGTMLTTGKEGVVQAHIGFGCFLCKKAYSHEDFKKAEEAAKKEVTDEPTGSTIIQ